MTVIAHYAMAGIELVRQTESGKHAECAWCGGKTKAGKVFRYGTIRDDDPAQRINWDKHVFCSKTCYEDYHS